MSDKKHALSLLADAQMSTAVDIRKLQSIAVEQLKLIAKLERDAALRAILAGIALWRVRNAMPGKFRAWVEKHAEVKKSQANNYMRLATVFLEKARVTKQEIAALPADSTAIEATDKLARQFFARAEKFVGDASLNELLVRYGIKGVTREGDAEGATAGAAEAAGGVQMYFAGFAEGVLQLRQLVDPQKVVAMSRAEIEEAKKLLDQAAEEMTQTRAEFLRIYAEVCANPQ